MDEGTMTMEPDVESRNAHARITWCQRPESTVLYQPYHGTAILLVPTVQDHALCTVGTVPVPR